MSRNSRPDRWGGFTLIELLVVVAIIGIFSALLVPVAARALAAGRRGACCSNLRQMQMAYQLYLDDHNGRFFRYREDRPDGRTLWYWGLGDSGAEGMRTLDKSQAKLAPYFAQVGGVEICPALPYGAAYFKQKFEIASYGYGINSYLLADFPSCMIAGVANAAGIARPCDTITWADAIQINTWQAPASPERPMLEEWYYLDAKAPPKFHFRHGRHANAVFADGSVRSFAPARLDPRCDGLSGYIEPANEDYYLRLVK